MKVNWQFMKKPSVIIGAVILFFILLFVLNKGSGSGAASTQTVNTGPSDAQVAAQTQLAIATMSAGLQGQAIQLDYAKSQDTNQTQIALATIAAAANTQSLTVQRDIASQGIAAQVHGLDLQYQTAVANNNFALSYAEQQFSYGLATTAINANLQNQLSITNANLQTTLSADQLKAYGYNIAGSAISTANKGDRDQLTAALIGAVSGQTISYGTPGAKGSVEVGYTNPPPPNGSSGQSGTSILNVISPISNLL